MIQVHDLRLVSAEQVGAWADHIAFNMRDSDVDEVAASSNLAPLDALRSSISLSTHGYCVVSDTCGPVAMFGAAPAGLDGSGAVWMLGTDGIRTEAYAIARATRKYFDILNDAYFLLWNFIDARNALSMRWLEWGGFKLLAEHPEHGPESRLFYSFARTALCATH